MKRQLRWVSLVSLGAAVAIGAVGCLGEESEDTTTNVGALSLGAALPGTNASQFATAEANFANTETQSDGLGPIFNQRSCSACHSAGATGGAG